MGNEDHETGDSFWAEVTADGSTSFDVRLHLGKRVIKLESTPDWTDSGSGDFNFAKGPYDNLLAEEWDLTIVIGRRIIRRVRRHEDKGGKTRVSFRYMGTHPDQDHLTSSCGLARIAEATAASPEVSALRPRLQPERGG